MIARAYDYRGRFIGARDMATGRFVADALAPMREVSRKRAKREARRMARAMQVLADGRTRSILPDDSTRNRSYGGHMVGADGEKITRQSYLTDRYAPIPGMVNAVKSSDPTLYSNARTVRRHTVPTGAMSPTRQARGIGAITAASHRMGDRARARATQSRGGKLTVRHVGA